MGRNKAGVSGAAGVKKRGACLLLIIWICVGLAACGDQPTVQAQFVMPTFPATDPPRPTATTEPTPTPVAVLADNGANSTPVPIGDINSANQATVAPLPSDLALPTLGAPPTTAPTKKTTSSPATGTKKPGTAAPAPTRGNTSPLPPDNAPPITEPAKLDWLETDVTRHTAPINAIALSPDDSLLASGGADTQLRLWNTATGKSTLLPPNHIAPISALAFAPDGKTLASGSDDHTLRLWRIENGALAPGDPPLLEGHTTRITAVAFSPDNKVMVSGAGYWRVQNDKVVYSSNGEVRLWNVFTPSQPRPDARIFTTPEGGPVLSVAASNDNFGAVGATGSLSVWNMQTGKLRFPSLKPPANGTRWAALAFIDKGFVAADNSGSVHLFDINGAEQSMLTESDTTAANPASVRMSVSADGKTYAVQHLAANGTRIVSVWDSVENKPLGKVADIAGQATVQPRAIALSHSAADRFVAATDNATIRTWSVSNLAAATRTWQGIVAPAASVAVLANNSAIATNPYSLYARQPVPGAPALHGMSKGGVVSQVSGGAQNGTVAIAASPDSTTIASAESAGSVRLWRGGTAAAQEVGRLVPPAGVNGAALDLAWSPDNRMLAAVYNGGAVVWDVQTRDATLLAGGTDDTMRVAWVGTTRRLLVGVPSQGISLWDVAKKAKLGTVDGTKSDLQYIGFADDGTLAAVADNKGVVSVWKLALLLGTTNGSAVSPGQLSPVALDRNNVLEDSFLTIQSPDFRISSLALSPNKRYLAVGTGVRAVEVWDLQTAQMTRLPCVSSTADIAWAADNSRIAITDTTGGLLNWRLSLPGVRN